MNSGRLIEVNKIEKPSLGFDDWPPNRGGRLIGGRLKGVRLYLFLETKGNYYLDHVGKSKCLRNEIYFS